MNHTTESQRMTTDSVPTQRSSQIIMSMGAFGCGAAIAPMVWFADSQVSQQFADFRLPGDLNKAIQISEVFAHGTGVMAILCTLWWIDVDRRRLIQFAAGMTLLSGLISNGLKSVFSRVRPHSGTLVDGAESWLPMFHGSFWDSSLRSFPSGHAATAVALAIGLSIVYPRGRFLFAFFAILACLQRIDSQAHYPSDVMAGAAIALGCCAFCMYWRPRITAK